MSGESKIEIAKGRDVTVVFDGKRCILMAINHAGGSIPECAALHQQMEHVRGLATFNDDPGTTHASVMDLFDRAIAAQEPSP